MNFDAKEFVGIKKKITGQVEAFNYHLNCSLLYVRGNKLYLNEKQILEFKNYKEVYKFILVDNKFKNYDSFYIRDLPPMSFSFFSFLKQIKKYLRNKVILEIPTFPYFEERKNATTTKLKLNYLLDEHFFSKSLYKYVDHVTTFNYFEEKVFNIDNIQLVNGISENQIPLIHKSIDSKNEINIIAVSTLVFWHGYDRLIMGLHEYIEKKLGNTIIKLHFVGEGPEKNNLIKMSEKYNLSNYIKFHGYKTGKELENVYKQASIGVSSLGLFRKNGAGDSLKAKEYLMAGLPIIVDENEKYYVGQEFVHEIISNNEPVKMLEIIEFYNNIKSSNQQIRNYCINNFSWNKQLSKVLQTINE